MVASPTHSRFVLGLSAGQEVRCCRNLDVAGRVIVRAGATGVVVGSSHDGTRIAVRFETIRGHLNVFRSDVQPVAVWKIGLRVEATRDLYATANVAAPDAAPLVRTSGVGVVLGLASDPSKLSVRFEQCPVPLNCQPHSDIEPAWRAAARRCQEAEESAARRVVQQTWLQEWEAAVHGFEAEGETQAFSLEMHVKVLVDDLLDEASAPQSLTGWTGAPASALGPADAKFRAASSTAVSKVVARVERRILAAATPADHLYFHGLRLFVGLGAAVDYAECEKYMRTAADREHAGALNMLGMISLTTGGGSPSSVAYAMDRFAIAASYGCVAAPYNVGCLHLGYYHTYRPAPSATPVPHDRKKAVRRLRAAAERGHASAQYRLGTTLLENSAGDGAAEGTSTADARRGCEEEAVEWLERSAEQRHAKAQHALARRCDDAGDAEGALRYLRAAAAQGHVDAQHKLGVALLAGPQRQPEAESAESDGSESSGYSESKFFSDGGKVEAQGTRDTPWPHWQGELCERLRAYEGATPAQQAEGIAWVREAACHAHVEAQNSLALCLLHGESVARHVAGGIAWLRHASNQECASALHNMGCCLFAGEGVAVDTRAAMNLWRRAARAGQAEAELKLMALAEWVFQGEEMVMQLLGERHPDAECELVLKVLAEKGLADAGKLAMSAAYHGAGSGGDGDGAERESEVYAALKDLVNEDSHATPRRMVRLLEPLQEKGEAGVSPVKQHANVDEMVQEGDDQDGAGEGVPVSSFGVHQRVHRPFCGTIHCELPGGVVGQLLEAQFSLGLQYLFGTFIEEDHQAAAQLFWRVADSTIVPHPGAQNALGVCFEHGLGVPKHTKMAVHWFRKAATQNLPVAMHNLATCLYAGDGVRKNVKEAVRWWKRAGELGYAQAMFRLALCELCGDGYRHDKASGLQHLDAAAKLGIKQAALLAESIQQTAYTNTETAAAAEGDAEASTCDTASQVRSAAPAKPTSETPKPETELAPDRTASET